MKKYDAYKPSGIEWIGEVPEGWKKSRFKNFVTLINKPTVGGNKIGLENIESGSGKFLPSDSEFDGDGVGFVVGDIVYGKLRPYLMKVWVAEFPGNAVGDFFVFRVKDNADSSFVKYLMLSDGFTKEANGATEGAKMPRVPSDFILTLRYCLPSKEEQTAIADYLDAKCAKIDNVIAVQQKRIELLKELKQSIITHAVTKGLDKNAKMKDSGIEWIGEVPEEWETRRLKFVCSKITDGSHFSPQTQENGKPYITVSNVNGDDIDYNNSPKISIEDFNNLVKNGCQPQVGDILLAKDGTVGRTAIVEKNDFVVLSSLGILSPGYNNSKFLKYLLDSDILQQQMINSMAGSAIQRITISKIVNFIGLVPPLEEQTAIVNYLDRKCAIIDRQIAKVEKQIELLNEYKQSVITECVTGKRKVC